MSTLYRKYRPQSFADVIGQEHVKIILQNEIERNELGHAYLFCGPRGLGKTTLARLFAKSVNCQNRKDGKNEPCNSCDSCTSIMTGSAVDIIEIDAASHTGVDNVRENIISNARFSPAVSKFKVFIIDEVHMLSISAFNALLKTLEEPPAHAIFILCTTETHKLPQTIISRCQRFDLKKVLAQDLRKKLEKVVKSENKKVESSVIDSIIAHSEGCVRDAESLLGKVLTLGDDISSDQADIILPISNFSQIAQLLDFIADKNSTEAIGLINGLVEDGVDLQIFTDNLLEFLRKIMLLKVSGDLSQYGIELDEEAGKLAQSLAEKIEYEKLIRAIDLFMVKRNDIKSALIQQFPLEIAILELTQSIKSSIEDESDDDDNESDPSGGQLDQTEISRSKKVTEKIKNSLSHLTPKKHPEPEVSLQNTDLDKEKVEEIKVDLTSKSDKLSGDSVVKFSKVKENWKKIVETLLEENYTLSSLLRIGEPLKCSGNVLEIGVKSKFYFNRLTEARNQKIVEKVISEILSAEVRINPIIKNDVTPIPMEVEGIGTAVGGNGSVAQPAQAMSAPSLNSAPLNPVAVEKPADASQDVMSMF
jgi:DNA polymerase-3 subunit gamma/tau